MRSLVGLATVLLLLAACRVAPDIRISNTTIPTLKGQAASFDNIDVDQKAHRLYVADRTDLGVDVFDIKSAQPTFVTTVGLPASPNGLAVAPDLQRVFAGLSDGSVAIIETEATTPTFLRAVQTGGKEADLLDYAAAGHQVFASNGIDDTITMLDGSSGAVTNHLKVGYALEQPRYNSADGLLYVTSPDAGALFALDPNSGAIRKK
ncbi:MAG TPA: hypothetical protein VET26_06955, partial [Candidatus Sulfotelmatobacter sp.]|nr:hypothetical protein [Candidatus Sulfotelmatobacter sp.]